MPKLRWRRRGWCSLTAALSLGAALFLPTMSPRSGGYSVLAFGGAFAMIILGLYGILCLIKSEIPPD